jgi:hypothetical protein
MVCPFVGGENDLYHKSTTKNQRDYIQIVKNVQEIGVDTID